MRTLLANVDLAHLSADIPPGAACVFGPVSRPQYHRLHHSRHERDYNKNFCDLVEVHDFAA